jgi:ADP-heptose:LPS heptosyltransferase
MRGRYLVRSLKALAFLRITDLLLRFVVPAKAPPPVPENPARILVCNWAHLGDVLLILPTLQALKDLFPQAKIDLLAGRGAKTVLEGTNLHGDIHFVDHFMLNRKKTTRLERIRTYLSDRRAFLRTAKNTAYDVAIDLYFYFPSVAPILWQAGIPVRCGFSSGGYGSLLTHPVPWSYEERHVSQFGLDLIKALWPAQAARLARLAPCYPGHPIRTTDAPARSPYIVIHPGAGQNSREWPETHWLTLVETLSRQRKEHLVFCGTGAREGDRAKRLAAKAAPGQASLFLDRNWSDYVALIADAAVVFCLESSAGHLAAAFSVPTVAIYTGCNEARLWGPNNPRARILTAPTLCAPCHRSDGCEAMACVRDVQPEDVLAELRDLETSPLLATIN